MDASLRIGVILQFAWVAKPYSHQFLFLFLFVCLKQHRDLKENKNMTSFNICWENMLDPYIDFCVLWNRTEDSLYREQKKDEPRLLFLYMQGMTHITVRHHFRTNHKERIFYLR